jgi:hypothetical protein
MTDLLNDVYKGYKIVKFIADLDFVEIELRKGKKTVTIAVKGEEDYATLRYEVTQEKRIPARQEKVTERVSM